MRSKQLSPQVQWNMERKGNEGDIYSASPKGSNLQVAPPWTNTESIILLYLSCYKQADFCKNDCHMQAS